MRTNEPSPEQLEIVRQFSTIVRDTCIALCWHDPLSGWPRFIRGASAMALRFPTRTLGVTAWHVIEAYRRDRVKNSRILCQFGKGGVDLGRLVIDEDEQLDIATFEISETLLKVDGYSALDCSGDWPPPPPKKGDLAIYAGYPEISREVLPNVELVHGCYESQSIVVSVTERSFMVHFDPDRHRHMPWTRFVPTPDLNISGCSGGPALIARTQPLLHLQPVGIFVAGKLGSGDGDSVGTALLQFNRIDCIRPDGTLNRGGWLPI